MLQLEENNFESMPEFCDDTVQRLLLTAPENPPQIGPVHCPASLTRKIAGPPIPTITEHALDSLWDAKSAIMKCN